MLQGYKREGLQVRKQADRRKHQLDASRLQAFPIAEMLKKAVMSAMIHLASIHMATEGHDDMIQHFKLASTTAMVGILYYNSFAGRSGEWEIMKKDHVLQQINANADHLVCSYDKTSDCYGDLAKYVPPGSTQAMQVYIWVPWKISELSLESTSQARPMSSCIPEQEFRSSVTTLF